MSKISVIAPIYKVEKYLPRCIESILNQTYKDIELILVDDGSPDNSGKICDEYASKDERVKVIHKKNEGVSKARNTGIECAQGEYFFFIDSDDYIDEVTLEHLYDVASKNDFDCVACGLRYVYEKDNRTEEYPLPQAEVYDWDNINSIYEKLLSFHGFDGIYAKLYKTEIAKRNQIKNAEHLCILEDGSFVFDMYRHCKRVAFVENCYYNYIQTLSSSLMKKYNDNVKDAIEYYFNSSKWILSHLSHENKDRYFCSLFSRILEFALQIYVRSNLKSKEKKTKLKELLKNNAVANIIREVKKECVPKKKRRVLKLMKKAKINTLHIVCSLIGFRRKRKS